MCLYLRFFIYGGERRREYELQRAKTITKQQVTTAYLKNITCVILKMEISANVLTSRLIIRRLFIIEILAYSANTIEY